MDVGGDHEQFIFNDPRQRATYERLLVAGPGPAGFFRDACLVMSKPWAFESTTNIVAHLLRETEGGLRGLLRFGVKPEGDDAHRVDIRGILDALAVPPDHALRALWPQWPNKLNPHKWAHGRGVREARAADAEFLEVWDWAQDVLFLVGDLLESRYTD